MTNREKWSPVIDKAFVDDIPLVDLLETIWQQAKEKTIKELEEKGDILPGYYIDKQTKKDYVPLIQEIHDKVAEEQYDKGYADAIDRFRLLIDGELFHIKDNQLVKKASMLVDDVYERMRNS